MEWKEGGRQWVFPSGATRIFLLGESLSALKIRQPDTDALDLNDCAAFLFHSEILIHKVALLFGGMSFPGHLCCLHWAVSFIYRLKRSRLEGSWSAWRRRLGVSMQLLSFGLTGLDWRYLLNLFFLSTWLSVALPASTNPDQTISSACSRSAQSYSGTLPTLVSFREQTYTVKFSDFIAVSFFK